MLFGMEPSVAAAELPARGSFKGTVAWWKTEILTICAPLTTTRDALTATAAAAGEVVWLNESNRLAAASASVTSISAPCRITCPEALVSAVHLHANRHQLHPFRTAVAIINGAPK